MIETVNTRDSYKMYKAKVVAANINREDQLVTLPVKEYIYIVNGFFKFLIGKVLAGKIVRLPINMGTLRIVGTKVKPRLNDKGNIEGLAPSWGKTWELWNRKPEAKENKEVVFCFNEHSNGLRFRYIWSKKSVALKNKTVYALKMSRPNKRAVYKIAHENGGANFLIVKPKVYGGSD